MAGWIDIRVNVIQAYLLLSTAPVEGRVSGIVDIPHAICTVAIFTEIFDFNIKPSSNEPKLVKRGDATSCK